MPYLHRVKKREPWFLWAAEETLKTGLRNAIFTPSGDQYKGEWLKNSKSGKGVQLRTTGLQYEGDWSTDKQNGWGVLSRYQADEKRFKLIYTGQYKDNYFDGFGCKEYEDGARYEGEFSKHKRDGYGRCWYPNESYYEGQWSNGLYHGFGMFIQGNGNRYEGEWKRGQKDGWGRFYHLDSGQVQEGYWVKGTCISSFMEDIAYRQAAVQPTNYPIPKHYLHPGTACLVFLNQATEKLMRYNQGCQFHKYCYSRTPPGGTTSH